MRKPLLAVLVCSFFAWSAAAEDAVTAPAASAVVAAAGKMLRSSDGARLGQVYRVTSDGAAQLIVDGRMVTVPAPTLSTVDGKLTTSLSKRDVIGLR